jgi:hypothetical protein
VLTLQEGFRSCQSPEGRPGAGSGVILPWWGASGGYGAGVMILSAVTRAIDEENNRPMPNRDAVSDLKRQKLRIKDEIFQLERH